MAAQVLADLIAEVARTKGVQASAAAELRGVVAQIEAAVQQALLNGATAEELLPVTAALAELKASTDDLSAAVDANP